MSNGYPANNVYIGARYVPKLVGEWDSTKETAYEPLIIVTYQGNSYTSRQYVPAGIDIGNTEYWVLTGNFNGQIESFRLALEAVNDKVKNFIQVSTFEGDTPAEKLQNAINFSIANYYPAINIDISVDITGTTIMINKGEFISDSKYERYRKKLVFTFSGSGEIVKRDAGYMFSSDRRSGDIAFINGHFIGNVNLRTSDTILSRKQGNSVFDLSTLFRLTTINCSFQMVGRVFDGRECTGPANNAQSIYSIADQCIYSHCTASLAYSYGVHFSNLLCENCNRCVTSENLTGNILIQTLTISDSCLEGLTEGAIVFTNDNSTTSINGLTIDRSYFEGNGAYNIILSNRFNYGIKITNSYFANEPTETAIKGLVRNTSWDISGCTVSKGTVFEFMDGDGSGFGVYATTIYSAATTMTKGKGFINNVVNTAGMNLPLKASDILLTDAHANAAINSFMLTFSDSDSISNLPGGVNKGLIIRQGDTANASVKVVSDSGVIYESYRIAGIGWTDWKQVSS